MSQFNVVGWELNQAVEIAKLHASSGNIRPIEDVIREAYKVIKELNNKE